MTAGAMSLADRFDPPDTAPCKWATPGDMAQELDRGTVQTPALRLIDQALVDVADGRCDRLIISMPPQEGKSQRVSRRFPAWMLVRNPTLRIAVASYAHGMARRWGRTVRDDMITHDLAKIDPSAGAASEWQLSNRVGGIYSVGITGALTGRPVDLLIIDDPIKDRQQAESQTWREQVWDWWTDVAITRLAPGAPVVLILTRWHEDDLAGQVLAAADGDLWRVINIPAQADHEPERGQTDALSREPGEWMVSARGRTVEQWEAKRIAVGARTWTALYQGRPSPTAGDVFERDWWRRYTIPPWRIEPDGTYWVDDGKLTQSWDMTFKDTKGSDYVVGQVWWKRDATAYLVDQVHARLSFTNTVAAFERLTAKWPQAAEKLVEDKANGSAVIDTLRLKIPGIVPVTPHESKYARAVSASVFVEAGNVLIPDTAIALFDVEAFVEEHAAFPNGTHDDQVDGCSQYLNRTMATHRGRGRVVYPR